MNIKQDGITPNAGRLLWAGFFAILAAGFFFGVRGGFLDNWATEFGFTGKENGGLMGAHFTAFCFGIIGGGLVCDRIGYAKLVTISCVLMAASAFIPFATSASYDTAANYEILYWGTFVFGLSHGVLEAVSNPLVATLFPNNRTHYLNILHASWPAGMVLGSATGWVVGDAIDWRWQLGLLIIPTAVYGLMFIGQHMPKSEASASGLSAGKMFKDVGILGVVIVGALLGLFVANTLGLGSWAGYAVAGASVIGIGVVTNFALGSIVLFVLFIAHALVGAVELGTDGWQQNVTGNILTPEQGNILFVLSSTIMFFLRFCADFIERRLRIPPLGILLICSVLACIGLNLMSGITTFAGAALAISIYAIGKTFFWPTMLAVAGDRFPRTGAIAMSFMGGIGMMSAGLIGSEGLGYAKDRFAGEALRSADAAVYAEYQAEKGEDFLFFDEVRGLDPKKYGAIQEKLNAERGRLAAAGDYDPEQAYAVLSDTERTVHSASIQGDRDTLVADSMIPAAMAVIFLLLMLYFRMQGGYRALKLEEQEGGRAT